MYFLLLELSDLYICFSEYLSTFYLQYAGRKKTLLKTQLCKSMEISTFSFSQNLTTLRIWLPKDLSWPGKAHSGSEWPFRGHCDYFLHLLWSSLNGRHCVALFQRGSWGLGGCVLPVASLHARGQQQSKGEAEAAPYTHHRSLSCPQSCPRSPLGALLNRLLGDYGFNEPWEHPQ